MNRTQITQHSIRSLLEEGVNYIIPMYQRNYSWDEAEITQLIQDVIDYLPKQQNYYLGTLVVFARVGSTGMIYETIDGQQRLTTLSLLALYLRNEKVPDASWYSDMRIDFENRDISRRTFDAIYNDAITTKSPAQQHEGEFNSAILNGYRLITKLLPQKLKEKDITSSSFAAYLFKYVHIMRVEVPPDTDLNHYFEIMNNRGEQLEKHEVLKSRLMEVLNDTVDIEERERSKRCLHLVWEACANMECYVQMGFSRDHRDALFGTGDWGRLLVTNFEHLSAELATHEAEASRPFANKLSQIVASAPPDQRSGAEEDEVPARFNTVVNFPNFLLQVLRVTRNPATPLEDIPLDDKQLLSTFDQYVIRSDDPIGKVRQFTYQLLRLKYLFDQYVLKREFTKGSDRWSLKRLKWTSGGPRSRSGHGSYVNTFGDDEESNGINRKILMLLSAFHVSTPTMVYKHWLSATLHYLCHASDFSGENYLTHLRSVANAFVFDRFLASQGALDYFEIIFSNRGTCQTRPTMVEIASIKSRLTFNSLENNLIFNYLDFLLWLKPEHNQQEAIRNYEFTFRSSVEHYYPQHPLAGVPPMEDESLNSFGNLCLISHSKNSRLSNLSPEAKKDYYRTNSLDSIKQHLMMAESPWDAASILKHDESMRKVLIEGLSS
jgi:hypothetical protein